MRLRTAAIFTFLGFGVLRLVLAAVGVLPVAPPPAIVEIRGSPAQRPTVPEPTLKGRPATPATSPTTDPSGAHEPVARPGAGSRDVGAEAMASALLERPQRMWESIYATFERHGATDSYRRRFDALAVRPLGVFPTAYREWMARQPATAPVLAEPVVALSHRMSRLNRAHRNALTDTRFKFLALRYANALEVVVGDDLGGLVLRPENMAGLMAALRDRVLQELDPPEQRALLALATYQDEIYTKARARFWTAVMADAPNARSQADRFQGVLAVLVIGQQAHVIFEEDAPDLAATVAELAALEESTRRGIEDLYR